MSKLLDWFSNNSEPSGAWILFKILFFLLLIPGLFMVAVKLLTA